MSAVRVCRGRGGGAVVLNTLGRFRASVFLLALRASLCLGFPWQCLALWNSMLRNVHIWGDFPLLTAAILFHGKQELTVYLSTPRDMFTAANLARSRFRHSLSLMVKKALCPYIRRDRTSAQVRCIKLLGITHISPLSSLIKEVVRLALVMRLLTWAFQLRLCSKWHPRTWSPC